MDFLVVASHNTKKEKIDTPYVLKHISIHNAFSNLQPLETKPFRKQGNTGTPNQKTDLKQCLHTV